MKILITGSNSGFGKLMVETLIKDGHGVAATMRATTSRNKASAEELTKIGADVIGDIELDYFSADLG